MGYVGYGEEMTHQVIVWIKNFISQYLKTKRKRNQIFLYDSYW